MQKRRSPPQRPRPALLRTIPFVSARVGSSPPCSGREGSLRPPRRWAGRPSGPRDRGHGMKRSKIAALAALGALLLLGAVAGVAIGAGRDTPSDTTTTTSTDTGTTTTSTTETTTTVATTTTTPTT